jgi:hypothetical protein
MTLPDCASDAALQARWEALHRQLELLRSVDPSSTQTDLDELILWISDQLDELEMQLSSLAFAAT